MDMVTQIQTFGWAVCILHVANYIGKDMNPIILSPTMGKLLSRLDFFNFGIVTSQGEGKLKSDLLNSTEKLTLCHILLVQKDWVNTYNSRS